MDTRGLSYGKFSKDIGVDVSQLHRIINNGSEAGPKFLGKFAMYCEKNKLNFSDFIFFNEVLTGRNDIG